MRVHVGKDTVLKSPRIEAICDRVLIINKGQIVADDKMAILQQKSADASIVMIEFDKPFNSKNLMLVTGVRRVEKLSENSCKVHGDKGMDLRPLLFNFSVDNGLSIITLHKEENSLESIFRQLTAQKIT